MEPLVNRVSTQTTRPEGEEKHVGDTALRRAEVDVSRRVVCQQMAVTLCTQGVVDMRQGPTPPQQTSLELATRPSGKGGRTSQLRPRVSVPQHIGQFQAG